MENKKFLKKFAGVYDKSFFYNLRSLLIMCLDENEHVSINRIQQEIGCGFNAGMKLKNILIDLHYINEKGYVIVSKQEINEIGC